MEPIIEAVGHYNVRQISPDTLLDFVTATVNWLIVVQELRPSDYRPQALDGHLKEQIGRPPHTIRINDKYVKPFWIEKLARVIITTN